MEARNLTNAVRLSHFFNSTNLEVVLESLSFEYTANPSAGLLEMKKALTSVRVAVSEDADAIARIFIESAEYHADLDPERYSVPAVETISARYRKDLQHPPDADGKAITLVAELGNEIVGFLDARLDQSPDPMHRKLIYCHVAEIAVSRRHQRQGIGERLLQAAEKWARQQGAQFASLEYHVANTGAGVFYLQQKYCAAHIIAVKRLQGPARRASRVKRNQLSPV
jgi:ribosomal protein S18 acetylase RimI-like enzyme